MNRELAFGAAAAIVALALGAGAILLRSQQTSSAAAVQSPMPKPLDVSGPFTCTDRTGGRGGKDFASMPQIKSLTLDRQSGVDRLVFEFAPGPSGPDAVPSYSIAQRFEPKFLHNDPQQTVTLRGSAGIDLEFGAIAATHGYWKFLATPSRLTLRHSIVRKLSIRRGCPSKRRIYGVVSKLHRSVREM